MQPVPTAPTAAEDGGLSTHVLHMTRLHAKRPLLVELRMINGPFEGGCRLQSGAGAWLACNTSNAKELLLTKRGDTLFLDFAGSYRTLCFVFASQTRSDVLERLL